MPDHAVPWWPGPVSDHLYESCPARQRSLPQLTRCGWHVQGAGGVDPLGTDICGWCRRVWIARNRPQQRTGEPQPMTPDEKRDHAAEIMLDAARAVAAHETVTPDLAELIETADVTIEWPDRDVTVLDEIAAELARQNTKWGEQNHPDGTGPAVVWSYTGPAAHVAENAKLETDRLAKEGFLTFRDILIEEVAEAMAEKDPAKLRTELIQMAAVAAQWVAAIDRREPNGGEPA